MARIPVPPITDLPDAEDVFFDDTLDPNCNLEVDNVQDAIDELACRDIRCSLVHIKCAPCPGGIVHMEAAHLTDQNFNNISKENC